MRKSSRFRIGPQLLVTGLAGAFMAYLTLIPLMMLLYGSFQSGPPGTDSDLTLKNYAVVFQNWRLVGAFLNSLIFTPLLAPGFVAGWIFVITHSFRELSTSIMLYRSGTEVISVVLFELWDAGQSRYRFSTWG